MKKIEQYSAPLWILERIKGNKRYLCLLIFGNILFASTIIMFSLGCQKLIDGAVAGDISQIKSYGIILLVLLVFRVVVRVLTNWLSEFLNAKLMNSMRQEILGQLLKKEYYYVGRYHSGELINRMFSDVKIVVEGILNILPLLANMGTRLFGAVIILIRLDKRFTFVFLSVGVATFLVTRLFRGKMKRLHKNVQEREGSVHAFLQETISNIRLIKSADMEKRVLMRNSLNQRDYFSAQMHRSFYTVTASAGMAFIFQLGYLGALIWGGYKISMHVMSYGTLTAILQLVGQIQVPFSNLSGVMQRFYGMFASAERLQELYQMKDEENFQNVLIDKKNSDFTELCFENLDFSYNDVPVLESVNFTVKQGDFIAVTGLSGGGKSTMFLLMLGIYQPKKGEIKIKSGNELFCTGKQTRGMFAYVPQGNTLFSGTIRENIMMFSEKAEEKDIWEATEIACIKNFLQELPEGLDTVIGERGMGLSEGQAQRIAVARALLSGAPVLLLDEATSALDNDTEKEMLRKISSLKNKTCIIVTHREEALSICNRYLHLENGHVTEVEGRINGRN